MFKVLAIAGTFDYLHKGHERFISLAFDFGEKVLIGLTSDIFEKIKTFDFQTRKKELEKLLEKKGLSARAKIVAIDDLYGPAVSNTEIEALVVTEETKVGGEKVNARRKELELPLLKLIIIPFVLAQDQEKIASTRIRFGEIDRKGQVYSYKLFVVSGRLPEKIRQELKRPQGVLLKGDSGHLQNLGSEINNKLNELKSPFIITVGDEVTRLVNSLSLESKLSIFDFRVNRQEKYKSLSELGIVAAVIPSDLPGISPRVSLGRNDIKLVEVSNPPGHITKELIKNIRESIEKIICGKEKRIAIKIEGEDDLAAVPAILLAPLGSVVLYGQPGEGVVMVEVTEERKEKIVKLLGPKAHQPLAENG